MLAKDADARSDLEADRLRAEFLIATDVAYADQDKRWRSLKAEEERAAKPVTTVMVMGDLPEPRMTYVLARGDYASPQKDRVVEPGVPAFLPSLPDEAPANRLGLAQWLVQPDHPLTARVAVNRYWMMLFGTGLVPSVEDFGRRANVRAIRNYSTGWQWISSKAAGMSNA